MTVLVLLAAIPLFAQSSVEIGRKLFFDTRLSADGAIACATCHDPKRAFADNRTLSVGVFGRRGERHVPSLIARGAGSLQFWDGRAATLEEQVLEPIKNPKEMDLPIQEALLRVKADTAYIGLTADSMAKSLAAYVRTIRSENSPVDRFLHGDDQSISDLEREGLRLFRDRARCYICHSGNHFTDELFHNTGVAWRNGKLQDEGRYAITQKIYHKGAFKTPTLREIANTAPYMHDGSIATLEDVIEFYDRGGNANPLRDENLRPLHLSDEDKRALLAFLRALSGTVRDSAP